MKAQRSIAWVIVVLLGSVANPSHAQTITEIIDATGDGGGNMLNSPRAIAADGSSNVYVAAEVSENAFGIDLKLYVDADASGANDGTSWTDAYTSLQDGLADADGVTITEVWVAAGTYYPDEGGGNVNGDRFATFQLANNVAIYGGFAGGETLLAERDPTANVTELSGDLDQDDVVPAIVSNLLTEATRLENSVHVVTGSGADVTARLDGFTITGGNADQAPDVNFSGAAMIAVSGSPMLVNCTFTANSALQGGAVFLDDSSSLRFIGCTFAANYASIGGGAVRSFTFGSQTTRFGNCRFIGNVAGDKGGAMSQQSGTLRITNCLFSGNVAFLGGGITVFGVTTVLADSTLVRNVTTSGGAGGVAGGLYVAGGAGTTTTSNSILWENSNPFGMPESAQITATALTINHSVIQGLTGALGGTGNIDVDPMFVDADGVDNTYGTDDDDMRLQIGSPVVDAGDNSAIPNDILDLDGDMNTAEPTPLDLDGNNRFIDDPDTTDCAQAPGTCGVAPIVDMGAFEFNPPVFVDVDAVGLADGTSWTNSYTTLQDALADARITGGEAEQIWVAAGMYYPDEGGGNVNGDRSASFLLKNNVAIYGGFAGGETMLSQRDIALNETTLSGDVDQDDMPGDFPGGATFAENSLHVVEGAGTDSTAVLDGFTISGGNANGNPAFLDDDGGGMFNGGSSPTVANCFFNGNSAVDLGGAMANDSGSSPTIESCVFEANVGGNGGAIGCINSSQPTVTDCEFLFNGLVGTTSSGGAALIGSGSSMNSTRTRFLNNTADSGAGVFNAATTSVFVNCEFVENEAVFFGGGMFNNVGANVILVNARFVGNTAANGAAVNNSNGSSPTLTNCTIANNDATSTGGGIRNDGVGSNSPVLTNCVVWNNSDSGGTDETAQIHTDSGAPFVNHSVVQGGWSGAGGVGIVSTDPLFVDADGADNVPGNDDDDLHIQVFSPAIDAGDNAAVPADTADLDDDMNTAETTPFDLDGNARFIDDPSIADTGVGTPPIVDMGAFELDPPPPVFVDADATGLADGTTWTDAYTTLQDALADALITGGDANQIWVAEGTYYPDEGGVAVNGVRTETFQLLDGVFLFGGFAGGETFASQRDPEHRVTILSGDLNQNDNPGDFPGGATFTDNSFHVVTGSGTSSMAVLDGFTITAANADGAFPDDRGAGMYNDTGSPTLTNCTFSRNSTEVTGGGMFNNNNSSPTVTNCTFSGNSALVGGGMVNLSSSPILTNCIFSGNSTLVEGGAMLNINSSPTLVDCSFIANSAAFFGGGLRNVNASHATVINCLFIGNSAESGGAVANELNSHPSITNCIFSGNSALSDSGAMDNFNNSNPTVANCTFSGNSAAGNGGGMATGMASSPTVINCILWGNSDSGGMDESAQIHTVSGTPVVNHSIVQGGWTGAGGVGNSAGDPLFVDAAGGNFALSVGSPAIDAGDNTGVPVDTADLDGDGDTAEVTPLDLDERSRFADDPDTTDCAQAPGTCGLAPIVDMGALEFLKPIFVDDTAAGANDGSSWANAYDDFRNALQAAAALNGDADPGNDVSQIWVAAGTYRPTEQSCGNVGDCGTQFSGASACTGGLCVWVNPRFQSFRMLDGIALLGGFAGFETTPVDRNFTASPTILSGDVDGDDAEVACTQDTPDCDGALGGLCLDGACIIKNNTAENSLHVVTATGIDATGVLDGFTITGGNAGVPAAGGTPIGGGVLAGFPGDGGGVTRATIRNCLLTGNSAGSFGEIGGSGAGMYSNRSNPLSSPSVRDCVFRGNACLGTNSVGGGLTYLRTSGEITGCTFVANTAINGGGGLFIGGLGGAVKLTNSVIVGNRSLGVPTRGGGLNICQGNQQITNCVFSGNIAPKGGALSISVSSTTIANCTFANNSATDSGGAVYQDNGAFTAVLDNCVLWENSDAGGSDASAQVHINSGPTEVARSIIQGGVPVAATDGGGNVDADPLFRDAKGLDLVFGTVDDDLRLLPGSPAIDAADNARVPADAADVDSDLDTVEPTPLDANNLTRFLDDPDTVDSGVGTPPIVDMGAIEFFLDCNDNAILDADDIAAMPEEDCDVNGIPDECDLADCDGSPGCSDCNDNGIMDQCDITLCPGDPTCADCNSNGVPDGCEPDCNANSIADECDIAAMTSDDCNVDGVPDECELTAMTATDCDGNGVLDACDLVACDPVATPGCDDCNINGVLDSCDIDSMTSLDVDLNGIPDECTVWNGNGMDNSWNNGNNWEGGMSPNNTGGDELGPMQTFSAVIDVVTSVNLDIAVTIDTLEMDASTLKVTGAVDQNLSVVQPGGIDNNGTILIANDRTISIPIGRLTLDEQGVYKADPMAASAVSASLSADNSLINKGLPGQTCTIGLDCVQGTMELTDSMSVTTVGDFVMDGTGATPVPPPMSTSAVILGGITPPPRLLMFSSVEAIAPTMNIGGNFVFRGSATVEFSPGVASTAGPMEPPTMLLDGDFVNHSVFPTGFAWAAGQLILQGSQVQRFEVGGEDLGPTSDGFNHPTGMHSNFSMASIEIAPGRDVIFEDQFLNMPAAAAEALYVDTLILRVGATMTIDNTNIYYVNLIDDGATISLCGSAVIQQIVGAGFDGPLNDDCAGASIACDTFIPFDTSLATTDGPIDCANPADSGTKDIWYRYTATCDGTLTVSLCDDTTFNSTIEVYDGVGCGASLGALLGCDSDGCGVIDGSSHITVPVITNQEVLVRIGGVTEDAGPGVLNLFCAVPVIETPLSENSLGILCGSPEDPACENESFCVANAGGGFPGRCYVPKHRSLSLDPNVANAGLMTARRVSVMTKGGPVVLGWVDAPTAAGGLGGAMTSGVAVAPVFRDWGIEGTVHLTDCHISTGRTYVIDSTINGVTFSPPLTLSTTNQWGDVIGGVVAGVAAPPQGVANLVDAQQIVKGFQGTNAAPLVWLDLHPASINRVINLADAQQAVKGFQGGTFFDMPGAVDPCECAGLAPCR